MAKKVVDNEIEIWYSDIVNKGDTKMKMRLTKDNIRHVTTIEQNGNITEYFVAMKSGKISDCRMYYTNDKSVAFPFCELPKCVQKFLQDDKVKLIRTETYGDDDIIHKVYKEV